MFRSILMTSALCLATAFPAAATDIDAMTDGERDAFRSEVRAYLLENPEVLMEAIAILEERRTQDASQAEVAMLEQYSEEIFNDGYSYVGGNPDGDVTVVEFLDYQCGFCKRAFPAVEELIDSDGNIRFIVKEFPILGDASVLASRYALAVKSLYGDDAYKTMHDEMMLLRGDLTPQTLVRLSGDFDFDHDDIRTEMDSEEITRIIAANRDLAARLQIQGTPSFIMGDTFVRGFLELDQMRRVVSTERQNRG
ncbi:DsbA family protein [uncultured Boseongicola sp.]|jgi:protein-disulfide isomerase|uniref:DsbA family protein n=1 Tax=uncultured Boseongicola sp. TaxID=1648499 RepID=UPI0026165F3E|nr:DsbA family protein [uncultured Boseongicola sp.]